MSISKTYIDINKTLKSNEFIIPHITTTQNKNAQEKLFSKWLR